MHRVAEVVPLDDYKLLLTFDNGEKRICDMSGSMSGVLSKLKNKGFFKTVKVNMGAVEWPGQLDFCPDAMYMRSVPAQR